jgi:hypothetical protein
VEIVRIREITPQERIMTFFRKGALVLAVAALLVATPTRIVTATSTTEDNQVPIENRPGNGSLHIYSDDTIEQEVVDPPSVLTVNSPNASTFCTNADSGDCAGQTNLGFVAHLPQCDTNEQTDCIVGVSATTASGQDSAATFDRYFPNLGPHSYVGKPSIKLPTGRAPSVWRIPSAPHIAGDEYAVVARLRGSTANRKGASFQIAITPVSVKLDADTQQNYSPPRWVAPGQLAGPASDRGLFRCAYWGENGSCLLSRSFPADIRFTVSVKLAVEPSGWLHGRINDPSISFTKDGNNTLVRVAAQPVQVPAFQVGKQYSEFSEEIQRAFAVNGPYGSGGSRQPNGQYQTDPTLRNAEYNIVSYKNEAFDQIALMTNTINDKAGWAPWIWRVRTLSNDEMTRAGSCLTSGDGVKGIVTTNATVYGSGPPAYNSTTKSLDYKVAAPHYTRTGEVFQGAYHLLIRSDVARCIYGFTSEPISADVSVVQASGTTGASTTSVGEQNGWFKVSVLGFTHSAPIIRTILRQTKFTPKLTTKVKRNISSATLARTAKISVPKKAKISLAISSKYQKKCKISGTSVRTLSKGTCVVRVTVTTVSKKRTIKNITITVK